MPQSFHEIIKPGVRVNFVGFRHRAFLISGLLILISLVCLAYRGGPRLGVDFAGGIQIMVSLKSSPSPEEVRQALTGTEGLLNPNIQTIQKPAGEPGENYLINIQDSGQLGPEVIESTVKNALGRAFGGPGAVKVERSEVVGPKVGQDMRQKALYAILYSILMITIYISGRFETRWGVSALLAGAILGITALAGLLKVGVVYLIVIALAVTLIACFLLRLRYAVGAIAALMHDVVVTVGLFSLLDKEITLSIVAALLTIVGYSLNDTIIIFDRIRENLRRSRKLPQAQVVNASINETLSRTVLTSGTTLVVVLSLYLMGGPVNQDFALALLFGIGIGTFSSIFVSAPILLLWDDLGRNKATA